MQIGKFLLLGIGVHGASKTERAPEEVVTARAEPRLLAAAPR